MHIYNIANYTVSLLSYDVPLSVVVNKIGKKKASFLLGCISIERRRGVSNADHQVKITNNLQGLRNKNVSTNHTIWPDAQNLASITRHSLSPATAKIFKFQRQLDAFL